MKTPYFLILLAILFLASCTEKTKPETEPVYEPVPENIEKITFLDLHKELLSPWLEYYKEYNLELDSFSKMTVESIMDISTHLDSAELIHPIHKEWYKYSPDSSTFLDLTSYNISLDKEDDGQIVSYGGDVDSQVSMTIPKEFFWKRLLFVGSYYIIEDGFWMDNNSMLIVGQCTENKVKPIIWFIDMKSNSITTFEYIYEIEGMQCDYLKETKYKHIIPAV